MADRQISHLLDDLESKKLELPEFQREFVWSPHNAKDLVDSLYHKFPVGSILLCRHQPNINIKSKNKIIPDWLILDGQQRLHALNRVRSGEIKVVFNVKNPEFKVENSALKKDPMWIRVDKIWESDRRQFHKDMARTLDIERSDYYDNYQPNIDMVKDILEQKIDVHEIYEPSYERITQIYMRLNKKGVKLKHAEIYLAYISLKFPKTFNEKLGAMTRKYEGWQLDANFFLRCFVCQLTKQSKYSALLSHLDNSDENKVLDILNQISKGLESAFNFLASEFGITHKNSSKLLPSQTPLVMLILYYIKYDGEITTRKNKEKLSLWFFAASFHGRYSGPIETILNEDISALKSSNDPISVWIKNMTKRYDLELKQFGGINNKNNYFALYYAIRTNSALDWWSGNKIETDPDIEFHHIFPKKILKNYDKEKINDVRNIAIVSQTSNRAISSMEPVEYFEDIDNERIFSQFIPKDNHLWKIENYELFLKERGENIKNHINQMIKEYSSSIIS